MSRLFVGFFSRGKEMRPNKSKEGASAPTDQHVDEKDTCESDESLQKRQALRCSKHRGSSC